MVYLKLDAVIWIQKLNANHAIIYQSDEFTYVSFSEYLDYEEK